jgi:GntR family transcriptional regulator
LANERVVDFHSPIYLQLREVVRGKIEDGEYPPGTAIPSENELAETYGINRLTVRSAIDALVSEGLLRRVQGKGVYVLGSKMERDLETLGGFTQTMLNKHAKPSTKILVKARRRAGSKYACIFSVPPDSELYYIKRLCYADGEPMSLEEILIPCDVVPKLEGIDLSVFSLYEVYDFYGVRLSRAWQTLDLAELEPNDARMLNVDRGRAVLLFSCTSCDEQGRVIEFSRSYTRGDKCNFTVHFQSNNNPDAGK